MSTAPLSAPGPAQERRLVFDGAEVRAVDARLFGSHACVVTFSSWTDEHTLEREGFGERFFRGEEIDAVHVLSLRNLWWAHPETRRAMAAVRAATAGYARVVTYGSSMGAYAAVRLADEAGANAVLAMSPQFSILPGVAPFEHRWADASRAIDPAWEAHLPLPRPAEAYLVHDPADLDGRHVELFARAGLPFTPVRLRNVGHQTAGFLQEVALLRPFLLETVAGPPDAPALEREAWRRRRRSPQHVLALAARVHDPERRVPIIARAEALVPGAPALVSRLGLALAAAGRFDEAFRAHARALAAAPGWPPLLLEHAASLRLAGRGDEAAGLETSATSAHAHKGGQDGLWGKEARIIPVDPGVRPRPGAPLIKARADERGCVLSGPLLMLRPGRYEVSFGVRSPAVRLLGDLRRLITLDVYAAGRRLARRRVSPWRLRLSGGRVRLPFVLTERAACEFRVFTRGGVALEVEPARPCRRLGPLAAPPQPSATASARRDAGGST